MEKRIFLGVRMKPSSAKAKGRVLQNFVASALQRLYGLTKHDIRPAVMGERGVDIHLSEAARKVCEFDIECKNMERLNLWKAWAQAVANTGENRRPLLVVKKNRKEPLVVISWEDFQELIKRKENK